MLFPQAMAAVEQAAGGPPLWEVDIDAAEPLTRQVAGFVQHLQALTTGP